MENKNLSKKIRDERLQYDQKLKEDEIKFKAARELAREKEIKEEEEKRSREIWLKNYTQEQTNKKIVNSIIGFIIGCILGFIVFFILGVVVEFGLVVVDTPQQEINSIVRSLGIICILGGGIVGVLTALKII